MSERLYPSIPDATPQELASNLENIYGDALNGELGPARQSSITAVAAHYARRIAEINAAVMPILGSFNATADDGRLIGLVSVEAATRALELVAPDERKDAK